MKNPFSKRASSGTTPAPTPAEQRAPVRPPVLYTAVSNLSSPHIFGGAVQPGYYPNGRGGVTLIQGEEQVFRTKEEAISWLKSLGCGGAVSDGDKLIADIPPGD